MMNLVIKRCAWYYWKSELEIKFLDMKLPTATIDSSKSIKIEHDTSELTARRDCRSICRIHLVFNIDNKTVTIHDYESVCLPSILLGTSDLGKSAGTVAKEQVPNPNTFVVG